MSRYSRDLYARLETGDRSLHRVRPVGHVRLATSPQRLDALRRASAWMHGFGVARARDLAPRSAGDVAPAATPTTCWPASTYPTRAAPIPVGVAASMAKGAKALGAQVIEGVTVTGVETNATAG